MNPNRAHVAAALGLAACLTARPSAAEQRPRLGDPVKKQMVRSVFERMPRERMRLLSGGALNVVQWAQAGSLGQNGAEGRTPAASGPAGAIPTYQAAPGVLIPRVSDPRLDFTRSLTTGFTQSETASAWCADSLVVGFNDSGSLLESIEAGGGLSLVGFGLSHDNGRTFLDLGSLPPHPDPNTFLAGDPSVVCTTAQLFHFSSLFLSFTETGVVSGVSVSASTNGGAVWAAPILAVGKDAAEHLLDKPWVTADVANTSHVYVTYTDFGSFGVSPGCAEFETSIELVRSTDRGLTWSAPLVLDEVCGVDPFVQGSQVVVGTGGEVQVVWERSTGPWQRELVNRTSTDGGATFAAPVRISDVVCSGDCFALQGGFRSGLEFPSLAVDRSAGPRRGTLYVAWTDGRSLQVTDEGAPLGFYAYSDILFSRSSDAGFTWSMPGTINRDRPKHNTDQYHPAIAVDRRGRVAACYYDRSLDPNNFSVARSCSQSGDGGDHWSLQRITQPGDLPLHGTDTQLNASYMGDYDSLASDTTLLAQGFVGGFAVQGRQGNQDVVANRLP